MKAYSSWIYDGCYVCIYLSASNDGECTFPCDPLDQLGNSGRFREVTFMDTVRSLGSHVEPRYRTLLISVTFSIRSAVSRSLNITLSGMSPKVSEISIALSGVASEVQVCVVEYDIFAAGDYLRARTIFRAISLLYLRAPSIAYAPRNRSSAPILPAEILLLGVKPSAYFSETLLLGVKPSAYSSETFLLGVKPSAYFSETFLLGVESGAYFSETLLGALLKLLGSLLKPLEIVGQSDQLIREYLVTGRLTRAVDCCPEFPTALR